MGCYTEETKDWLEDRYRKVTSEGIYIAHQNIYGFRDPNCDSYHMLKYINTYQIMRLLSHSKFDSLLDAGCAEGYTLAVARELFPVSKLMGCDISQQACLRTKEIFGITAKPSDIQHLPFENEEFDVVLSSETIEHISDFQAAIIELLRVAKHAVIITVPRQSQDVIDKQISNKVPHAHLHSFNESSFDFVQNEVKDILSSGQRSFLLDKLCKLVEAAPIINPMFPRFIKLIYKYIRPIIRCCTGTNTVAILIKLDRLLCRLTNTNTQMIFVLLKNKKAYSHDIINSASLKEIIKFKVPYHYLKETNQC